MNGQLLKHFNSHLKSATCTFMFLGAIAVGFFPTRLAAQANGFSLAVQDSTARATPGTRYRAGWFHRLLLGNGYRDSWIQPIEVSATLNDDAFGKFLTMFNQYDITPPGDKVIDAEQQIDLEGPE